jgi:amino acid transporter
MGGLIGGPMVARAFRVALVLGGMMSAFGMFNALVMSYSRVPLAMAQDGMLPRVFAKLTRRTDAPWVSIVVLAVCWAPCLLLGFERLVSLDVLLYGMSLMLEFVALVALRIKEPTLRRPFKVPGGMIGAVLLGIFPLMLLVVSVVHGQDERILGMSGVAFGLLLIAGGFAAWGVKSLVGNFSSTGGKARATGLRRAA